MYIFEKGCFVPWSGQGSEGMVVSRLFRQIVSLTLSLAFLATETLSIALAEMVHPASVVSSLPMIASDSIENIIQDPGKIHTPVEYASVKEIHKGTSGKLFILIEDAHANYSGQKSLAGILDDYMSRYKMSLVLSEGASRDCTLDEVKPIADKKTWKIAAKRFLMDGVIKGEEYLNLTTDHKMQIRGIEYPDLYDKSLVAYSRIVKRRHAILDYIGQFMNAG